MSNVPRYELLKPNRLGYCNMLRSIVAVRYLLPGIKIKWKELLLLIRDR